MDLGYQRGFVHSELYMGTNAIGMCIETESPVVIWERSISIRTVGLGWFCGSDKIDNRLRAVIFAMVPIEFAFRNCWRSYQWRLIVWTSSWS